MASRESYAWCISSALAMGGAVLHTHIQGLFPVLKHDRITLKFDKISDSVAAETTTKFQSDWKTVKKNKKTRAFEISRYLTIRRIELASAPLKTHLIT